MGKTRVEMGRKAVEGSDRNGRGQAPPCREGIHL